MLRGSGWAGLAAVLLALLAAPLASAQDCVPGTPQAVTNLKVLAVNSTTVQVRVLTTINMHAMRAAAPGGGAAVRRADGGGGGGRAP